MLLEVRDLSVDYGAIRALDRVSFGVAEGQIVAVIGANGAGKSTIMNAICGLVKIAGGSVLLQGADISRCAPHAIVARGVVQVPEGRGIFGNLTVKENLEVAATTRRDTGAVAADMNHVYDLFPRLRERTAQMAGTLSGGEQQMLALGRALVTRGRVLLLDEPSMGLAPNLVSDVFRVIRRINEEGSTILLVEQNAYQALSIAHQAHVLETGRIVLSGSGRHLRDDERVKAAYLGG